MKKRKTSIVVTLRYSEETDTQISKIASAEGKTKSEVLRMLVEKGLAAGGYLPGVKELDTVVQEAVAAVMQPAVERLAAISAKSAHIGAAAFSSRSTPTGCSCRRVPAPSWTALPRGRGGLVLNT